MGLPLEGESNVGPERRWVRGPESALLFTQVCLRRRQENVHGRGGTPVKVDDEAQRGRDEEARPAGRGVSESQPVAPPKKASKKREFWQKKLECINEYSPVVSHPSTNSSTCCLTSEIRRDQVLSTVYERIQRFKVVQELSSWTH
jgi:hypothetical protein